MVWLTSLRRQVIWREMGSLLSRGKVVITDRLHASISSLLLGKTHIMIDQSYGKINGCREVAFAKSAMCRDADMHAFTASTLDDALERAVALLARAHYYN